MHSRAGPIALLLLLVVLGCPSASADSVVPTSTNYANYVRESDQAKVCGINLEIENPAPPERVKFAVFADYDKSENAVAIGFRIGASRRSAAGSFKPIKIAGCTFDSPTFNSADEMDLEVYDEAVFTAATSDRIAASRLLRAVAAGNFSINLLSDEQGEDEWTYKISVPPSAEVQFSFAHCLEGIMPGQVLSRTAPVRLAR